LNIRRSTINALFVFAIFLYLFSIPVSYYAQRQILEQQLYQGHYIAHWLNALLTGIITYQFYLSVKNKKNIGLQTTELFTWAFCLFFLIFITVETHLIANALFYSAGNPLPEIQRIFIKTGWPIVWGLCSFLFMWLGMRFKFRPLRIISLTLFSITLAKLFLYDIRNIPAAGKIAAFFSLGILLLVVSFMYQRLKKIIIDNEEVKGENES
jgi:uncharacterized membrane protein